MKLLLTISFLLSFVVFSQSDSLKRKFDSIPQKPIVIKVFGCGDISDYDIPQKEKDSLFNLYKITEVLIEDSLQKDEERIINTMYVDFREPIIFYPKYPGGPVAMKDFIDSSFVYPKDEVPNIKGTVYVDFVIDTLGQLDSFKVMKGLTLLIDKEALRVVEFFPNFTPYIFGGMKKTIHYTVPIKMNKDGESLIKAKYPGGEEAMHQFIQENFIYPKVLWEKGGKGVIWTKVLIESDGSISSVEVVKGLQVDFDKEIVRVIKLMPNWKPARMPNGIKVSAYIMIPIKI